MSIVHVTPDDRFLIGVSTANQFYVAGTDRASIPEHRAADRAGYVRSLSEAHVVLAAVRAYAGWSFPDPAEGREARAPSRVDAEAAAGRALSDYVDAVRALRLAVGALVDAVITEVCGTVDAR